jgi:2-(1,2-epoxy-1,2-dihydrophenyl)acetyl-CoA isomerase
LSLALACDLRVALDTAKLTTAFSKVGASGDFGGSYFLPRLVGAAKARELYFMADVILGQEACELGLVNYAYPAETFESEAQQLAAKLAALPTIAVGYMKRNLNAADSAGLSQVLDLEAEHMVRTMMTEDHARAAQAFVEKRPPVFEGN